MTSRNGKPVAKAYHSAVGHAGRAAALRRDGRQTVTAVVQPRGGSAGLPTVTCGSSGVLSGRASVGFLPGDLFRRQRSPSSFLLCHREGTGRGSNGGEAGSFRYHMQLGTLCFCTVDRSGNVPMPRVSRWDRKRPDWSSGAGLGKATMLRWPETRGSGRFVGRLIRNYATRILTLPNAKPTSAHVPVIYL